MKLNNLLNESSLSRVWKHNEEHDCGAITAFRVGPGDGTGEEKYSRKQNLQRNKSLAAKLKSFGFGVTVLHGTYPEGGKTKREISFFVVDLEDSGKLKKVLRKLGKMFEQDSILFMPKGSIQNKAKAYLIGTNSYDNNWLGMGRKELFNKAKIGYHSRIYTSRVNGRPFIFEHVGKDVPSPVSGQGLMALNLMAQKEWRKIQMEDVEWLKL